MFKFTDLPKKSQQKILTETDYELSFIKINQKSSLQQNQKILDKSTIPTIVDGNFGTVSNVLNMRLNIIRTNPVIRTQTVFVFKESLKKNTTRTKNNKILLDGGIAVGENLFIMVNKETLYEEKLKEDKVSYTKTRAIIISAIQPVPGGLSEFFGKISTTITEPIVIIFCNALGDTCLILQNQQKNNEVMQQIKNLLD